MQTELIHSKNLDRKKWDEFILNSPQGSIFTLSWFIDCVTDDWSALVVHENGVWEGVMPLNVRKKVFIRYSYQPLLSRYWGVLLRNPKFAKTYDEYHWKKKVVREIVTHIPKNVMAFSHTFSPCFDYGLPFFWNRYRLLTRYTYMLGIDRPLEQLAEGFKEPVRKRMMKKEDADVSILADDSVETLLYLIEENRKAGKNILPDDAEIRKQFKHIYSALKERNMCRHLTARQKSGETIASCLFLDFKETTYYFSGSVHPAFRNTAIMTRLIAESIRGVPRSVKTLDFHGSMIEGIEAFFRGFGATPVPYLSIEKFKFPFSIISV